MCPFLFGGKKLETQDRFKYLNEYNRIPATIGDKCYLIYAVNSHTGKVHANRVVNGEVVPFITIIGTPTIFCTIFFKGKKMHKVEVDGQISYVSEGALK